MLPVSKLMLEIQGSLEKCLFQMLTSITFHYITIKPSLWQEHFVSSHTNKCTAPDVNIHRQAKQLEEPAQSWKNDTTDMISQQELRTNHAITLVCSV